MTLAFGRDMKTPISRHTAANYKWANVCDGWPLIAGEDLSVVEECVPPAAAETRHYHVTARQFFYVLSGEATLEIEGEEQTICVGSGSEVPPGKRHKLMNRSSANVFFLVISAPTTKGDRINVE